MRVLLALGALLSATAVHALDYPETPRGTVVDIYHGEQVADPYRWLEDVDAPEVKKWIAAQNALTRAHLDQLPDRAAWRARLAQLWNYEKYGAPKRVAGALFYRYNDGLLDQSVLVREQAGQRKVVLDPNTLSADGTLALTDWAVSPDGRYLAYGVAEAGSDWNRYHVRDLRTGQDRAEVLEHIKFSNISWSHDSAGFFYSRYPGSDGVFSDLENQAIYYHKLGSAQAQDVLVLSDPEHPRRNMYARVSDDGRYLLISLREGAREENALYVRDLNQAERPFVRGRLIKLVDDFSAKYQVIGVDGPYVYALTTDAAPNGRIVRLDVRHPGRQKTVVEAGQWPIEDARLAGQHLAVVVMRDAVNKLLVYPLDGSSATPVVLPELGSISGLRAAPDGRSVSFTHASFVSPARQLEVDLSDLRVTTLNQARLPVDTSDFVTEQVFFSSREGTRVPMFILRKRGHPGGPRPTWLYGYGGFSISLTPWFKPERLAWLEQGGVFVVANLRGGGEYGAAWHKAGTLHNKQNVFDDFIAAAESLIETGITSPEQLTIEGRSNGGLLVGAVSNQRPELFAAALPGVGVMDMLRFHKFTIGWAWTGDYGSSDDADMFKVLRDYSPYHNVPGGDDYPATMVTTADHDDRVVPGHSFKFAAALQHADPGSAPKLIRIQTRAGHGAGMPTHMRIEQAADEMSFAAFHSGLQRAAKIPWQKLVAR